MKLKSLENNVIRVLNIAEQEDWKGYPSYKWLELRKKIRKCIRRYASSSEGVK